MLLWKGDPRRRFRVPLCVSILVLLDVALKGCINICVIPPMWVSILVLLDVALKVYLRLERPEQWKCFNPCSLGCCSERILKTLSQAVGIRSFNPCSLGCCSESGRIAHPGILVESLFQSLFSWMLLWKDLQAITLDIPPNCFNPCSLGCCSESSIPYRYAYQWLQFQSLFSWMLLWKDVAPGNMYTLTVQFQSLFSWMLLWKRFPETHRSVWAGVSILVLLDVALKAVGTINPIISKTKFQSLFSWMLLWKHSRENSNHIPDTVSILVLLDVALKGNGRQVGLILTGMFQSLFSWMLLWKDTKPMLAFVGSSVSILVLLDVALKGQPRTSRMHRVSSFNPCSLGCCSESQGRRLCTSLVYRFQSLFSWMLLWKLLRFMLLRNGMIVSILVLLDVALKDYVTVTDAKNETSFNPCSLGCCSERRITMLGR